MERGAALRCLWMLSRSARSCWRVGEGKGNHASDCSGFFHLAGKIKYLNTGFDLKSRGGARARVALCLVFK